MSLFMGFIIFCIGGAVICEIIYQRWGMRYHLMAMFCMIVLVFFITRAIFVGG